MDQNSFLPQARRIFRWRKRKRSEKHPGFPKPCDVCNVVLNVKLEYEAHINGKRHMKELKKKELQEKLGKGDEAKSGEQTKELIVIDPKTSLRTCSVCYIEFNSPMIEQSHMKGKRHQKMLQMFSAGCKIPKPPAKSFVGRCEICAVNYTSPSLMKSHLSGKKHKKKCGMREVPGGRGFPTPSEQPPTKKIKLRPVIKPGLVKTAAKPEDHKVLEKKAEEAYEEYRSVASKIPLAEAQALYLKYQTIYRAYEAAYQKHLTCKEDTK